MTSDSLEEEIGLQRIQELLSVLPSFTLLAGLQLDVFTRLADRPATATGLAGLLGVEVPRLERLLYALVAIEFLEIRSGENEGDLFANTPEADRFLVEGSADFVGHERHLWSRVWEAALQTADSVRSDSPRAMLDFTELPREELRTFLKGLHRGAVSTGEELARRWLSSCTTVLDVGGGSGGLSVALTRCCPQLTATIVELPTVAPVTRELVEAEGAAERVSVVAADLGGAATEPTPRDLAAGHFDAAVCKSFLQCLGPSEAKRAVVRMARLLRPGGELFVIGVGLLDDTRVTPAHATLFDLVFLNIYEGGRAYTESEHREWLAAAGLEKVERLELDDGSPFLRGRKPE
jgi:SAM-dependent methyltransferase